MVTVVYWRYAAKHEHECDTLDEAIAFLAYGNDRGDLASEEIRDGDRVIREDELDELVLNYPLV